VISLSAARPASSAASYYATDNYYTQGQNRDASAWEGKAAAALGLTGPVEAAAFTAILEGKLPDGSVVGPKTGEHRPGLDLTFSPAKSVSLVALVGGDERVVEALRQAVSATLLWAERNIAEARSWDGQRQVPEKTGNLVAATFLHDVNRNDEPQLHVHAVIANVTQRASDGAWRALHNGEIYKRQHVLGTVFNADLRARIEALGYATEPAHNARDGSFEISGFSREAIEAFSSRSAEMRAALEAEGRGSPRERELAVLATRSPKVPEKDPVARAERWAETAERVDLDVGRIVDDARARSARGETVWTRAAQGLRGIGEQGMAIAARMGLTPRHGDPLVPERLGRLGPVAFAAAQAVASAARDLGQREAAFDRMDLIRVALERGGPVTVNDIEARLALLETKGLLIGDGGKLVTTEAAVKAEREVLGLMERGKGRGAPLLGAAEARAMAQEEARTLDLRRLNPAQEGAAALILSSPDRVVAVQGVSGAGKSAVLAPVAAIAKEQGAPVLGLAVAGVIAAKLAADTGASAMTVARFLARHERIAEGTASTAQLARARSEYGGALIMVDKASQLATHQMRALLRIAEGIGAGRVALIGDRRQLGAVDAGKPFAQGQDNGLATATLPENLRARSPLMKEVAAAMNEGDVPRAFAALEPMTVQVPREEVGSRAVALWAGLPPEERDQTLLLTSGRALKAEANSAAQDALKQAGALGDKGLSLTVLDRISVTREQARQVSTYRVGQVLELRTDLTRQGLARGDMGKVIAIERGKVVLTMRDGTKRIFEPQRLSPNLKADAVMLQETRQLTLHAGDRIRWSANDDQRGLLNAGLARVDAIGQGGAQVTSLIDGSTHTLKQGDPMLARLDLAYALNVHAAQGVTTENGIVMMSARERLLAAENGFLVAMTRIADRATLVVDRAPDLERLVFRQSGAKTSAIETARIGESAQKGAALDDRKSYQGSVHRTDPDIR
jgi:conjugative relaxase-like TrwC/TraI family protein